MKRGTPDHPKTHDLAEALAVDIWGAVGVLESLFHFTAQYAKRGDIGRHSNVAIARGLGWKGKPDGLVSALVSSGWVDECRCHRLLLHDWPAHCDQTVQRSEVIRTEGFVECYENPSVKLESTSLPLPLPLPLPTPTPTPEPKPTPPPKGGSGGGSISGFIEAYNRVFGKRKKIHPKLQEKWRARMKQGHEAGNLAVLPFLIPSYNATKKRSLQTPEVYLRDGQEREPFAWVTALLEHASDGAELSSEHIEMAKEQGAWPRLQALGAKAAEEKDYAY